MFKLFMSESKPTRTTYNAMRVLAMLMVLGVHTLNECEQFMEQYNTTWYLNNVLTCLFMISNPLFFMLSGKFNLRYKFENLKDYWVFYYKKAVSIILPLLIFSGITYLAMTPVSEYNIKMFIKGLMNNEIEGVYWFVYTLISILALSPFFTKMVENMTKIDKTMFFYALIIFNAGITAFQFIGNNRFFSYGTFGVISWHVFYFFGYLIEDVMDTRKKQNVFMSLGVVGFLMHFGMARFCVNPPINIYDTSPWLILEAISVYLIFCRINFKDNFFAKMIDELAGLSFVFYLLHMVVLKKVVVLFPLYESATITWLCTAATFFVSFVILVVVSYIITKFLLKPMTKYLNGLLISQR